MFPSHDPYGHSYSACCWCHYIYIQTHNIPDKEYAKKLLLDPKVDDKGRVSYDYMSSECANIELHGGITYYRRHEGDCVELGCDYQHYWDENQQYSLEDVLGEVKRSIESLHERTTYLVPCRGCGELAELLNTFEVLGRDEEVLYSKSCGCEWSKRAMEKESKP